MALYIARRQARRWRAQRFERTESRWLAMTARTFPARTEMELAHFSKVERRFVVRALDGRRVEEVPHPGPPAGDSGKS